MKESKLKCILTLSNGSKEKVEIIPKDKVLFPEQLEKDLVNDFNRMLANTPNRVVKCHLMRN